MGACHPVIQLTDACPTFYLVLEDSCFLSSLESSVRGLKSHFTYLQALISYLFMVSHYGTSWTFLYSKLISFVHFFFLDKCSYSSNLNEPILPKVFVVLYSFTMSLHRVVPYLLQPPGTRLAVRKELSQTNMLMLSYLKIGPGNINCPVSKNCPASSPLGAPHQPQVGLLEQLQISLQCKGEFCSWTWPIMANIF